MLSAYTLVSAAVHAAGCCHHQVRLAILMSPLHCCLAAVHGARLLAHPVAGHICLRVSQHPCVSVVHCSLSKTCGTLNKRYRQRGALHHTAPTTRNERYRTCRQQQTRLQVDLQLRNQAPPQKAMHRLVLLRCPTHQSLAPAWHSKVARQVVVVVIQMMAL